MPQILFNTISDVPLVRPALSPPARTLAEELRDTALITRPHPRDLPASDAERTAYHRGHRDARLAIAKALIADERLRAPALLAAAEGCCNTKSTEANMTHTKSPTRRNPDDIAYGMVQRSDTNTGGPAGGEHMGDVLIYNKDSGHYEKVCRLNFESASGAVCTIARAIAAMIRHDRRSETVPSEDEIMRNANQILGIPTTQAGVAMAEDELSREFAKECPSTHCNRREECASPNDCIRTEKARADAAIVAALPRTADGVPIVPLMTVYCLAGEYVDERVVIGPCGKMALFTREPMQHGAGGGQSHRLANTVYADRAKAIHAAKSTAHGG